MNKKDFCGVIDKLNKKKEKQMRLKLLILICLICSISFVAYKKIEFVKKPRRNLLIDCAEYLANEDSMFEKFYKFAESMEEIGKKQKGNITKPTYKNNDYWCAFLEVIPKDSTFFFTQAFFHAAHSDLALANLYFIAGGLINYKNHIN